MTGGAFRTRGAARRVQRGAHARWALRASPRKRQTREGDQRERAGFTGSLHPRLPKGPRSTRDTTQHPGLGPTARSGPGRAPGHGAGSGARPLLSSPRPLGHRGAGQPCRDVPRQPLQAAAAAPRPGQLATGAGEGPDPQPREENEKAQQQLPRLHLPAGKEMHKGVSLAHPRRLQPGGRKDAPGASAPQSRRPSWQGSA